MEERQTAWPEQAGWPGEEGWPTTRLNTHCRLPTYLGYCRTNQKSKQPTNQPVSQMVLNAQKYIPALGINTGT